jgi:uncharacterized protein (TIGR00725 family)
MPRLHRAKRSRRLAVAVCGTGQPDPQAMAAARQVGRLIAEADCTLVCGGMYGVMEAACAGAREARQRGAGGLIVGILPGADPDGGNAHCDVVVATGMGAARNVLVVLSADVVILIGGGAGTLSEAALAWQFGKPLIGLSSSGGWAARLAGETIDERRPDRVLEARSPEEAVTAALGFAGRG